MNQSYLANSGVHRPHDQRAAIYICASSDPRTAGGVPLPNQVKDAQEYCARFGLTPVQWFIEPEVADNVRKRRSFMEMIEIACSPGRPYDVVLVHSFPRFFDVVVMELAIRKLRNHDVELVLISQSLGLDPAQQMMRQIIGIFDEYSAREDAKRLNHRTNQGA